jgi:hypothetical protein
MLLRFQRHRRAAWEVTPDGTSPRMLTAGDGRRNQIVYRYRSLDPDERAIRKGQARRERHVQADGHDDLAAVQDK